MRVEQGMEGRIVTNKEKRSNLVAGLPDQGSVAAVFQPGRRLSDGDGCHPEFSQHPGWKVSETIQLWEEKGRCRKL